MNIIRFTKKLTGKILLAFSLSAVLIGLLFFAAQKNFPIVQEVLPNAIYGNIILARPFITHRAMIVVFVDTKKFPAENLAYRIAQAGAAVAIFDTDHALQVFSEGENHCLNPDRVMAVEDILATWAHASKDKPSIVAGIGNGSLLPFLSAGTKSGGGSKNLSVGFSAQLPDGINVCSPWISAITQGKQVLTSSPALQGKWLSVWTDQPENTTAVFVRGLANAKTAIEPYDTPLDIVTVHELQKLLTEKDSAQANPFPVVEVPAKASNETVTLFYSGDGGWRDLDRDVAEEMAVRGYPVVGVDTLRAFWSSKTPEESASELTALMAYYRTIWKAKNFVLAGYSFGADILPAVYNRLSEADRKSVALIVLLALGKTADFEIHVSGWIGKSNDGLPILPELNRIQGNKILCIFGKEEKADSACSELSTSGTTLLELPGGHHFDRDYPKLAMQIIDHYRQIGLTGSD
jgi:type IV secretory pathway VirJ component